MKNTIIALSVLIIAFAKGSYAQLDTTFVPVKMAYFYGEPSERGADIFWATHSEVNSSLFEVEVSENASTFRKAGTVQSFGNSTSLVSYSMHLDIENSFYARLKQVDNDGKYEYFDIIHVEKEASGMPNRLIGCSVLVSDGESAFVVSTDGKITPVPDGNISGIHGILVIRSSSGIVYSRKI